MLWAWDVHASPEEQGAFSAPRILVIDDDEVDRLHSRRLLTEIFGSELRLDVATTWNEALQAVAADVHDIYLVDYFLGSGTGLEIVESAPQTDRNRIFILLTGQENRDVDLAATRVGVADFLLKTDLDVKRLERSLRYANESMRQKRLLIEQTDELRKAKAAVDKEIRKQQILTRELTEAQSQLTETLSRAETSEQRYRWLAQHDMLTQIPNRTLFNERLRECLEQTSRTRKGLALLLLDLDRFKWVNDSLGHQAGDELLVQVARRLIETVRETDVVARIGGDEFAILATNLDDEQSAALVADKVIAALSQPFEIFGHHFETSASIGVVLVAADDRKDPKVAIQEVDSALYRAKASGRGLFRFYDEVLDKEVQRALLIKRELPLAIAANDLTLAFQPKVRLADGAVTGLEALIRWTHPVHGPISPAEFIPMAESTGQIIPLSAWILDEALETVTSWKGTALEGLRLALNLSAVQLKQGGLVGGVQERLRFFDLSPSILELEITETAALENLELATCQLNQLRSLGVSIAIDDFGTGYSSLALATSLPADCLKIDRSFVAGMLENRADAAAVGSTVTLAKSLGFGTVAEGVETEAQRIYLKDHGCDEAQGYLFAKPQPKDEILRWYEARRRNLLSVA
ncbi:putative bifunctional diguanylate cyclase/phosphodiesterase [Algihabitans albus]|uniref:putative bifunctional diguanylate cyclase/phosphodiesterase n=1 Tax=Algihabitans albus TaxID=2164067 RepID=UPI000E5D2CB2|nr:GGDEF domain-containing response regulator [Algihabitans albus]